MYGQAKAMCMRQVSVLLMLQKGCGGWAKESYDCLWAVR